MLHSWTAMITLLYIDAVSAIFKITDVLQAGGGVSGLVVANRLTEDPNGKSCLHLANLD